MAPALDRPGQGRGSGLQRIGERDMAGKKQGITGFLLWMALSALLAWRCFYGLGWQDEAAHLVLTKRLYEGAVPFAEEWHVCQLSAALLIPFYALYQKLQAVFPGGIILFFRMLYLFFWIAGSIYCYCLTKKVFNRKVSYVVMLTIMLYCRSNIFTLSYISMGPMLFVMAMLSWYVTGYGKDGYSDKSRKRLGLFGGVLCFQCLMQPLCGAVFYCVIRVPDLWSDKEKKGSGV